MPQIKKIVSISTVKSKKVLLLLALAAIFISGCTIKFGSGGTVAVAGVFKSFDKGNTWMQKNLFIHSGGAGNISGLNVTGLIFDPQDNKAIYLASAGQGLFYSYDSGDSWQKAAGLKDGPVAAVAVDPKNKCVIYTTFAATILKSLDCNRSWSEVYIDTRATKADITSLAIDSYNNLVIYAGNSAGDVLKSIDGGQNWQAITRLNDKIAKILIDPKNTKIVYAATKGKGIFKTENGGADWSDINAGLKSYSAALEYRSLIFDLSQPNALLLVSKYGLIKTNDGGASWTPIKLITPAASTEIYSVAINPQNSNEIYYSTATTFYKTTDGGQNWVTKRLPSNATATYMTNDPNNPSILYMGMSNLSKK